MTEKTPKEIAYNLLDFVNKGKEVYDIFSDRFKKQYMIAGSSIQTWEDRFKVAVPHDSNVQDCKAIDLVLMRLYQEASFHKALATAAAEALANGSDGEYRKQFTTLVADYEKKQLKLPAADTLKTLTQDKVQDIYASVIAAKVAEAFWNDILKHLDKCAKLVENLTFNNSTDAKLNHRM